MTEFEIKGHTYRVAKLNVFDQLKVSRKLLPVLAQVMSDLNHLKMAQEKGDIYPLLETTLPKIAGVIADLPDENVDAILHPCLSVVVRQHMKSWTPVFSQGHLAFDDIELFTMLQLVARVVADSLGNFLQELPTSQTPPLPAQ